MRPVLPHPGNVRPRPILVIETFDKLILRRGMRKQFQQYRDATNGDACIPEIDLSTNIYADQPFETWDKYKDIPASAVIETFRYIFTKLKKGIFVKIKGNKVVVFLPFFEGTFYQ